MVVSSEVEAVICVWRISTRGCLHAPSAPLKPVSSSVLRHSSSTIELLLHLTHLDCTPCVSPCPQYFFFPICTCHFSLLRWRRTRRRWGASDLAPHTTLFPPRVHRRLSTFLMSCGLYFYSSAPTCQCHRASPSPPGLVVMLLFIFSFPDTQLFMTCVLSLGTPVTHPTTNQKPTQAVSHPSLALITTGTNNSYFTHKSGWRHLPWFQQSFPPPRHRRRPPRRHTSPLIFDTHPGEMSRRVSVENFGALEKCGEVKRGCLELGLIDFVSRGSDQKRGENFFTLVAG